MWPDKLEPCDIIFTFSKKSVISKLIWVVSKHRDDDKLRKRVSHVALYLGDDLYFEMSFGGAVIKNINALSTKKYELLVGRYCGCHEIDKQCIIASAKLRAGTTRYAYLQLIAIMIKKIFGLHKVGDVSKDSMMCSEAIAALFKMCGAQDLFPHLNAAEVTPLNLLNSAEFEIMGVE